MNELAPLAAQVGVNERTLRRAVNEGVLRGDRLSPRRLKLSAAEKEYLLAHWSLLARLREVLRTEPSVRFALLFGSTARGDDTEESDVDLMVEPADRERFDPIHLAGKLAEALNRDVDVIELRDARLNARLFADALREGRVVVDRADLWPKLSGEIEQAQRRARREVPRRARRALREIDRWLAPTEAHVS